MIFWKNFLRKASDDFKNKECKFNHFEGMNIITIASKREMSYDFYIKKICVL